MATTRIIPMHVNKGKTIAQCLTERTDYAKNPDKTEDGEYISAYACDAKTADSEFLLSKRQYRQLTGREQASDVIAYQIRQSFKPGEVTPEEANQLGYEQSLMLLVDALGEGWSIVGVTTGTPFEMGNFSAKFILKYDGTLASGADTTAMFNQVKIPAAIENGQTFGTITVKAEAIQADGFDTWEAAFAAFDA